MMRLLLVILLVSAAAIVDARGEAGHGEHAFHHHHAGVFLGGMTPLSETKNTSLAVGVDYEYRFNPLWGVGGGADLVIGEHERDLIAEVGGTYRVIPELSLKLGAGFEVVEKEKIKDGKTTTEHKVYPVATVGAGYEIAVGTYSIAPTVYFDFVGETKTNLTYGLTFGRGF